MDYIDEYSAQFAEAFLGDRDGDGDIPFREQLEVWLLNYSHESLHAVDRYLSFLRKKIRTISDQEYQNVIVWAGAYLGEVIRRNATSEKHWVEYEPYMNQPGRDPKLRGMFPYMLTTHVLLVTIPSGSMTIPLNKIARWLDEGEANNLHYYAAGEINRQ